MKKRISVLSFLFVFSCLFASEVGTLLDEAKSAYEKGDRQGALAKINSAKKIIDSEDISASSSEYIYVNSWNLVKLKYDEYKGKRIRIVGEFYGVSSNGKKVMLREIGGPDDNTFEPSLIDKILSLEEYKSYVFYGVVKTGLFGPYLHIEKIK